MHNLVHYLEFVKGQIAFHTKKAAYFVRDGQRSNLDQQRAQAHTRMAAQFSELLQYLEDMGLEKPAHKNQVFSTKLGLTPAELDGLPPELLEELSISEADKADFAVLSVIDDAGGVLSLDKLLIGLYRKTGEINKRTQLNSRLYRMGQKGAIFSVPGKKGVYSTKQLSEEEADNLS